MEINPVSFLFNVSLSEVTNKRKNNEKVNLLIIVSFNINVKELANIIMIVPIIKGTEDITINLSHEILIFFNPKQKPLKNPSKEMSIATKIS